MLTPPKLSRDWILACLNDAYGLELARAAFLPIGADINGAVYRVTGHSGVQKLPAPLPMIGRTTEHTSISRSSKPRARPASRRHRPVVQSSGPSQSPWSGPHGHSGEQKLPAGSAAAQVAVSRLSAPPGMTRRRTPAGRLVVCGCGEPVAHGHVAPAPQWPPGATPPVRRRGVVSQDCAWTAACTSGPYAHRHRLRALRRDRRIGRARSRRATPLDPDAGRRDGGDLGR